ncbi:MAG: undecaprenyldiphospho-muramoylpentapeptide beta-N-acetylglucosaminyltransferase [Candidatus Giovannonibacteria bacterium GW2011_GWA2_44_13b]|uniref:UDP-N-acetylglucosamine--N-acetylmuramyl-(pentapeptide) pyrophosphoryl-undecaprenol N-acetylglucosamine transferase n=2 Tax=Candidatus Giovannoniibacteriota TaxID=1752738 RepID=A0A0G1H4P5_9BACT|nr:MAG: undecaprenyldiphospho-muramoylpentapeptide beta-N-acetylglucosaminyltransferase [Candidatus Giovannonibacteria bacterium GW2011_GWA2_44_13b]OGF82789.1 MAG: undecaprenyldiphospho-muramoylpentapeptide beta-N-acetylglucosaminyltransferase [Candidatus Giovannonibacteria bacterium RIFCSPLOWO2_01_FULL_44_16]
MKILLAGGGSGGHFYPLIAVVRALRRAAEQENIAKIEFFLTADEPVDPGMLLEERIVFIKIPAGKLRRYFSFKHFGDSIKTLTGIFSAFWKLYKLVPDVIFSKGGYASFPVLVAAKILGIPVLIHESDTVPGMVNQWAGNWVNRIAVSFEESLQYFEGKNIALVGNPVRPQIIGGNMAEAIDYFKLEEGIPVILILGGSQGSERLNETILTGLADMVKKYQIIHQTGKNNFMDVTGRADILLEKIDLKHRYHAFPFFEEGELRNASKAASIVASRAGAGSIFEIAAWGLPAILIPLPSAAQDHQRENAYAYARSGACEVIEETNLTPHLLIAQIDKILADKERIAKMNKAAQIFSRLDAAEKIGRELLKLGIHE